MYYDIVFQLVNDPTALAETETAYCNAAEVELNAQDGFSIEAKSSNFLGETESHNLKAF